MNFSGSLAVDSLINFRLAKRQKRCILFKNNLPWTNIIICPWKVWTGLSPEASIKAFLACNLLAVLLCP